MNFHLQIPNVASEIASNAAAIKGLKSQVSSDSKFSSLNQSVQSLSTNLNNLVNYVKNDVVLKPTQPKNLAPYYWIQATHNDPYTFTVPVQQGKRYWISAQVAPQSGIDNPVNVRAFSAWNIADEWGDIIPDDAGAPAGRQYMISFIAPKTGDMPIYFNSANVAKALQAGANNTSIYQITITQSDKYIPYTKCDNNSQSIDNPTQDTGDETAISEFGPQAIQGYKGHPYNANTANINLFPYYWVDSTHNDYYTFKVPVQSGNTYQLSFVVANNPSGTPIRASSSWNIADEWGDIIKGDDGTAPLNSVYHIQFTAPQTGKMPIEFMFTSVASAMRNGGANMMIKRITMTQGYHYIPYQNCNNEYQSLADVTGDAGMDAKAMFGNL